MCVQEYFRLVLCWEVCPLSECPLSEVSLYSRNSSDTDRLPERKGHSLNVPTGHCIVDTLSFKKGKIRRFQWGSSVKH